MRRLLTMALTACITIFGPVAGHAQTGNAPLSVDQERALKPTDIFKECDKCPAMVVVPAGSFVMGSPQSERGRLDAMGWSDEEPSHNVTFARPFAVGRFAITVNEWEACVADQGCGRNAPAEIKGERGALGALQGLSGAERESLQRQWGRGRQPAIFISWDDAADYVGWISRKTGKPYRLLSESEREYVTRAGTTTPFWWGDSISPSQANYNGSLRYGAGDRGENRGRPVPVDSFQPNPWGLYQVHGNIWEWTADCYAGSYRDAPTDGSARACAPNENERLRVMRGGSWVGSPSNLRSASRYRNLQWYRSHDLGFRVARTL